MQLRDFDPAIIFPGHWGFLAGALQEGETPEQGVQRELEEEISWSTEEIEFLGSLEVGYDRLIHAYQCELDIELSLLQLKEGQEIKFFSSKEIMSEMLYSNRIKEYFPLSPISKATFAYFIVK